MPAPSSANRTTESQILTSYLLPPSPLPTIVPFSTFLKHLPLALRHKPSNPSTKRLYRDLQFQRSIDIDTVRENIERECHRSAAHKARLARAIRTEQAHSLGGLEGDVRTTTKKRKREKETVTGEDLNSPTTDSREVELDTGLHHGPGAAGLASAPPRTRYHSMPTLLAEMSGAISDLEAEIAELDAQTAEALARMRETVGGLSDLRYGRFARIGAMGDESRLDGAGRGGGGVEEGVLEALGELRKVLEVDK